MRENIRPDEGAGKRRKDLDTVRLTAEDRAAHQNRDSGGISRRGFLTGVGATALVGLSAPDLPALTTSIAHFLDDVLGNGQFDYDRDVVRARDLLKQAYNIDLIAGADKVNGQVQISGGRVSLDSYKQMIGALFQSLKMYPMEMVREISPAHSLKVHIIDKPVVHQEGHEPRRVGGAAPDSDNITGITSLALDSSAPLDFVRRNIHHELNHKFARLYDDPRSRDATWTGLHEGISQPYRPVAEGVNGHSVPREHYFLEEQAGSAPIEDQAVCAEYMLTPALHADFRKKIRDEADPMAKQILENKYNEVIKEYERWSKGKMGKQYWEAVLARAEADGAARQQ